MFQFCIINLYNRTLQTCEYDNILKRIRSALLRLSSKVSESQFFYITQVFKSRSHLDKSSLDLLMLFVSLLPLMLVNKDYQSSLMCLVNDPYCTCDRSGSSVVDRQLKRVCPPSEEDSVPAVVVHRRPRTRRRSDHLRHNASHHHQQVRDNVIPSNSHRYRNHRHRGAWSTKVCCKEIRQLANAAEDPSSATISHQNCKVSAVSADVRILEVAQPIRHIR